MFEGRKAAIAKFGLNVDPKYIAIIKPISENPAMIAAHKKRSDLQEQHKAIVKQIDQFYHGPTVSSGPMPSRDADAQALLAGVAVAELSGQGKDTEFQNLIRQREALTQAIEMQQCVIQELESRLVREDLRDNKALRKWKIENEVKPEIDLCEKLIAALKQKEVDNNFLGHCGYPMNLRPLGFTTSDYEQFLLFGGCNFRNLESHIDWLRKTWGLDEKK